MGEDGACLFRAVSDQVYGDQEMHSTVRKHCMDYIVCHNASKSLVSYMWFASFSAFLQLMGDLDNQWRVSNRFSCCFLFLRRLPMVTTFRSIWQRISPRMWAGKGLKMFTEIILKCRLWARCTIAILKCFVTVLVRLSLFIFIKMTPFNHLFVHFHRTNQHFPRCTSDRQWTYSIVVSPRSPLQ